MSWRFIKRLDAFVAMCITNSLHLTDKDTVLGGREFHKSAAGRSAARSTARFPPTRGELKEMRLTPSFFFFLLAIRRRARSLNQTVRVSYRRGNATYVSASLTAR